MPNRIGKISAARSVAYISSFIGEKGMLFYDTTTGNIRLSDGVTPGGVALSLSTTTFTAGDFLFSANNMSTINANENVNILSNGTGTVNLVGPTNLYTTSSGLGGQAYFSTNSLGQIKHTDLNPTSATATLTITGNADGSVVTPTNLGVMLQLNGVSGQAARAYVDGNGNYSNLSLRRYNGSAASPSQVLSTQVIGRLGFNGYATGGFASFGQARIEVIALDNLTSTAQGTQMNFYVTAPGTNTISNVASINSTGFLPNIDNTYNLGTATYRWKNLYVGPGTIYITDQTTNSLAAITINNGVFNVNGIVQAQLPKILASTVTGLSASGNLALGDPSDTGTIQLNRTLTFSDSSVQSTAGIPLTQKAAASGVATLDATGRLSSSQIPSSLSAAIVYKGSWNASTNTPTLSASLPAGVQAGWEYAISNSGTQNIGSGSVSYAQGGFVIYNGATWDYIAPVSGVTSINGSLTGAVTGIVTTSDSATVTNTMLAGSIANSKLLNSSITVTGGTGLGVTGSPVALGGTVTLSNTGVTSIVAGSNVSISGSTGAVTINATGAVSSISAGTAISVSASTGAVTINNTGVTSAVAGTHITVSGSTGAVTIATDATNANTASTIVARDSSGNFSAGSITASRLILGNRTVTGGTTLTVDFSSDSIVLWSVPTGNGTITLTNYTAGAVVRVLIRFTTARNIAMGVATANNSTTAGTTLTGTGGGAQFGANQAVQLVYTCVDGTSTNTYVAASYV